MTRRWLGNTCSAHGFFHGILQETSSVWWRCSTGSPGLTRARGSTDKRDEGKTYCHAHSLAAFGDLRSIAPGRYTVPKPASKSSSCCALIFCRWRSNGLARFTGSIVTLSLPPLPSRTVICADNVDRRLFSPLDTYAAA